MDQGVTRIDSDGLAGRNMICPGKFVERESMF
jgi:hypothetical protein